LADDHRKISVLVGFDDPKPCLLQRLDDPSGADADLL
jgi:hypothetical protein